MLLSFSPLPLCISAPLRYAFLFILLPGGSLPHSRPTMTTKPQQRHPPLLLPHLRHNGGASPVSRRFLWRKILNSAARLLFPAVQRGDKFAISATTFS